MKVNEIILEGGWTDTVTQGTKITPSVVKAAMKTLEHFTASLNSYLQQSDIPPVKVGAPTGSTAYHNVDDETAEYGDIDVQMVVPEIPGKTPNQITTMYNDLVDDYIRKAQPSYVHDQGKDAKGHVIFKLDDEVYVQVDLLWATENISDWAQWRTTPQRGVKGLIYGGMYASLGDVLNMSLQTNGAQVKIKDGATVPFRTRKGTELQTISTDITRFGLDILRFMARMQGVQGKIQVDPELRKYPGLKKENVLISDLAHMVKGLAKSFERNDMFGHGNLAKYETPSMMLDDFMAEFRAKAEKAANAPKFNKAQGEEGRAMVAATRAKIAKGLDLVTKAMAY